MNGFWFVIAGSILIFTGLVGTAFKRLPCSTAMFYLAVGVVLGPAVTGKLDIDVSQHATLLRSIAEVSVLISLFAVGLRLRLPPSDRLWRLPLRLGILAMLVTIALLTGLGVTMLHLTPGAAVLLAAIIAPTDPVLAHDVQIHNPGDRDAVRFALSGEGGMNDGTAYPFVMLGLGLLQPGGFHGHDLLRWAGVDLIWGISAGAAIGWLLGGGTGQLVVYLRQRFNQALGLEGFFSLGLIALSYGIAVGLHAYGFLAVFAAGVAMRRVEHRSSGDREPHAVVGEVAMGDLEATATDPQRAHAFMTETVLGFTGEIERVGEVIVIVLVGTLLSPELVRWPVLALIAALFLVIRPLSIALTVTRRCATTPQRRLIGWFGIRGAGSFYYLMLATEHGQGALLTPYVLAVIAVSVVVHGVSGTPLMNWYQKQRAAR
jgi:NhaP-type Na+/H+ or K+/H+ antiporter